MSPRLQVNWKLLQFLNEEYLHKTFQLSIKYYTIATLKCVSSFLVYTKQFCSKLVQSVKSTKLLNGRDTCYLYFLYKIR